MTLPWPLSAENTAKLAPAPVVDVPPPGAPRPSIARRVAKRAVHSPVGRFAKRGTDAVVRRSMAPQIVRQDELAGEIHELRVQLARLGQAPSWYEEGVRRDTNLELLKAEVRSLERSVLELGMQLAPATGIAGVGARMGELREQVNAVSRRTQQLDQTVRRLGKTRGSAPTVQPDAATAQVVPTSEATSEASTASTMDMLFDYVAFERRFRGSPDEILAVQSERYAELLADHAPVLDWGCGRGELLELLASRGVDVVGVEIDGGMVSEARSRGLTVHQVDAVSYMSTIEPESLGAVFSAHVAEHIPFEALLEVIHASLRALRPGGVFVAETPNPTSLVVPSNSFILDPTHLRPIHPSLFAFACETAGFRDVRLTFYSPATGYHVPALEPDGSERTEQLNAAFNRLNEVLFGPQEYSIIATKADPSG
ncbi:MAG TPA: methyltransferase domain-containing protein [Lapillicoccus sp.]|nr:methyltransferase domain-containing protein [Lapillicoccus sp.]